MNITQRAAWWPVVVCLAVVCGLAAVVHAGRAAQSSRAASPTELFQQAKHQEEAVGDLQAAIDLYRQVMAVTPDRALAARAQLRIAACYDRLRKPEAMTAYQAVVSDYADQSASVAIARAWLSAHLPAGQQTKLAVERIWAGRDVNLEGEPSADGRFVAFIDWSGKYANLAIRNLQTSQNRLLTQNATGDDWAENPIVSPDGTQIAYRFGEKDSTIRLINSDGTHTRVLLHDGHHNYLRGWSPDGRYLAANRTNADKTESIVLISTADGSVTQLKSTRSADVQLRGFSPDGRFLLYAIDKTASTVNGGIFLLAKDGSGETQVVKASEQGSTSFKSPVWSPDGRRILFVSDRSGVPGLWSVPVVGQRADGEPMLVQSNVGTAMNPMRFTRDGVFYYGVQQSQNDVFVADFDATSLTASNPLPITDRSIGNNAFPSFSPDGKYVAFARSNPQDVLILRTLATGSERELTTYRGVYGAQGVQWFPDSRSVLITSGVNGKSKRFRKVDIDSGQEQLLLEVPWGVWIGALAPDGQSLFYSSKENGVIRLLKRSLASGAEVELYRNDQGHGTGLFGLTASPDGTRLAFSLNVITPTGDARVLFIMAAEGGTPREISRKAFSAPGLAMRPNGVMSWSKDGKQLLVPCGEDDSDVCAVSTDTGIPRALGTRMQEIVTASLSADGKRIAFTGRTNMAELWAIRNLLPAAKSQ